MKLRIKNIACVGVIFFTIMLLWQGYNWIVPRYLNESISKWLESLFGQDSVSEVLTGLIMGLDNILALALIPIVSKMSDKASTSIGKRMPYIVVGLPIAAVAFAFVPIARHSFVLLIIALLFVLSGMNIYRSPAVALMPDITPKMHRTKANALINLMGALGTGVGSLLFMVYEPLGLPDFVPIVAISLIMLGCLFFVLFKVDENKFAAITKVDLKRHFKGNTELIAKEMGEDEPDSAEVGRVKTRNVKAQRKNIIFILMSIFFFYMASNAVETWLSTYGKDVLGGDANSFPALLGLAAGSFIFLYPSAMLAEKFGRKIVMTIGLSIIFFAALGAYFIQSYTVWVFLPFFAFGTGMSFMITNMYPMLINFCSKKNYAKYTGHYYLTTMLAQSITPALAGFFISSVFNGGARSARNVMLYAAVFMIFAIVSLLFVNIQNSKTGKSKSFKSIFKRKLKREKQKTTRKSSKEK